MIKFLLLMLTLCTSVSSSIAGENELLTIFRTDKKELMWMNIVTDDNNEILNIKVISNKRTQSANIAQIYEGATLFTQKAISVIKLHSTDLDSQLGGYVKLIYLKKFRIFKNNIYGEVELRVLKNEEGKWRVYHNGKVVNQVLITPYTWGIRTLSFQ